MAEPGLVHIGWKAISKHLRVNPKTARKWKDDWGMPVVYLAGRPVITSQMIETWMLKAIELDYEKKNSPGSLPFSTA